MGKVKDLTGQKFGRLTVVRQNGFSDKNKYGNRYAKRRERRANETDNIR